MCIIILQGAPKDSCLLAGTVLINITVIGDPCNWLQTVHQLINIMFTQAKSVVHVVHFYIKVIFLLGLFLAIQSILISRNKSERI